MGRFNRATATRLDMAEVVTLPTLGLSETGELVAWEVDVGERVEADEMLAVIESDKASAEVYAPRAGVLLRTYVDEGEALEIDPGRPIAVIGEEGEAAPSLAELEAGDAGMGETAAEGTADAAASAGAENGDGDSGAEDPKATPRARRYADEHDVDLAAVEGTGPEDAVTEDDVREYREAADAGEANAVGDADRTAGGGAGEARATPSARRAAREHGVDLEAVAAASEAAVVDQSDVEAVVEGDGGAEPGPAVEPVTTTSEGLTVTEARELSGTRRTVAERLTRSAREKPHVMGTREVSVERLLDVRERLQAVSEFEGTLNDLLLHFVGRTLEDRPAFNAHFVDGEHRLIDEVNVGYAVDSEKGLVVPVVEAVPGRSLHDLAAERRQLVGAVLDDEHTPADLQGGTFTVTNVGTLGMDVSASIINPPEVAILAVGRRTPAAVERDGDVQFEESVTLSLTIDHRVLDGGDAGAFLDTLAEYLEYPGRALDAV